MDRRGTRLAAGAALGCVALALAPVPLPAYEWYLKPSFTLRSEFNDNKRLRIDDNDPVVEVTAAARANAGVRSPRSELRLDARADRRRNPGNSELNTDDQTVEAYISHATTRSVFRLDGSFARDSTLTSELEDTGLVQERKRRNSHTLSPSWSHALSERTTLRLSYQLSEVSYEDAEATGLVDYGNRAVQGSVVHQLTERTSLSISVDASRLDVPALGRETDSHSVQFGIGLQMSETLTVQASAGIRTEASHIRFGGFSLDEEGSGYLYDIQASKAFQSTTLTGAVSRTVSPSGLGELRQRDRATLSVRHKFSPKLSFSFNSTMQRSSSSGGADDDDVRYLTVAPTVNWRLTPKWSLSGGYRYRTQEQGGEEGTAESNAFFVSTRYGWQPMMLSR